MSEPIDLLSQWSLERWASIIAVTSSVYFALRAHFIRGYQREVVAAEITEINRRLNIVCAHLIHRGDLPEDLTSQLMYKQQEGTGQ